MVIIAKNLKVTLSIVLLSYFNNSNGLPELQMNLPSFMGYFNNSVFSVYIIIRTSVNENFKTITNFNKTFKYPINPVEGTDCALPLHLLNSGFTSAHYKTINTTSTGSSSVLYSAICQKFPSTGNNFTL